MRYAILPVSMSLMIAASLLAPALAQDDADQPANPSFDNSATTSTNPSRTTGDNRASSNSNNKNANSHTTANLLDAAKAYPPSLKLSQLNSQWRRFTISGDDSDTDLNNFGMRMIMRMRMLESLGMGIYYTRGETITMGDQSYLVAYRIDNEMDQQELQQAFQEMFDGDGDNDSPAGPVRFLPNTKLALSLLNLHTSGSIEDVIKFEPAREIMGAGEITAMSTQNLRRLSHLMQAFGRYQALPFKDIRTMQAALQNQAHRRIPRLLVHPLTREPYRPNTRVAGKRINQISNIKRVVAIYEASPGTDNKRGVVFLDGHVERVPEANWKGVFAEQPQGPNAQEIHKLSARNMQRLSRLMIRIARARGTFPDMSDSSEVYEALMEWGEYESDVYTHPRTGEAYKGNPKLSNKKLADITNRAQLVVFYESRPGSDGKIGAAFMDGHVERFDMARWKRVIAVAPRMKAGKRARVAGLPPDAGTKSGVAVGY